MAKGECVCCSALIDISDDIVECTACGSLMSVSGWKPFRLEILEPGRSRAGEVEPLTEQALKRYRTGVRRAVALFVDAIVLLLIALLMGLIGSSLNSTPFMVIPFFIYPASWAYSVLMHGRYGQTVGKMACGIRVLDISERPITMRQAFLRDGVKIGLDIATLLMISPYVLSEGGGIDSYAPGRGMQGAIGFAQIIWILAEILTFLTNRKRRAVHDFIADTVVVRI